MMICLNFELLIDVVKPIIKGNYDHDLKITILENSDGGK